MLSSKTNPINIGSRKGLKNTYLKNRYLKIPNKQNNNTHLHMPYTFFKLFLIALLLFVVIGMFIGAIYLFSEKGKLKIVKYINDYKKSLFGIEFKLIFLIVMGIISMISLVLIILGIIEIIISNNYQTGFNFFKISFSGFVAVGTISMGYVGFLNISKASYIKFPALDLKKQLESIQFIYFASAIRDVKGYNVLILDRNLGKKAGEALFDNQKSEEIKNKGDFIITIADYETNYNDIYYNDIIGKKENFINYYKSNKKDISLLLEGIGDEELFKIIPDLYKKIIEYNKLFKNYLNLLKEYNISPVLNVEEENLRRIIKELKEPSAVLYKLDTEITNAIAIVVKKLEIV